MMKQLSKPLALIFVMIAGAGFSSSGDPDNTCHSLYGGHMEEVLLFQAGGSPAERGAQEAQPCGDHRHHHAPQTCRFAATAAAAAAAAAAATAASIAPTRYSFIRSSERASCQLFQL